MSGAYTNYLASTSFRPYLQPISYLGTSNRTAGAILLGGRTNSAGGSTRIYNYLNNAGKLDFYTQNFRNILKANYYQSNIASRNHTFGF